MGKITTILPSFIKIGGGTKNFYYQHIFGCVNFFFSHYKWRGKKQTTYTKIENRIDFENYKSNRVDEKFIVCLLRPSRIERKFFQVDSNRIGEFSSRSKPTGLAEAGSWRSSSKILLEAQGGMDDILLMAVRQSS